MNEHASTLRESWHFKRANQIDSRDYTPRAVKKHVNPNRSILLKCLGRLMCIKVSLYLFNYLAEPHATYSTITKNCCLRTYVFDSSNSNKIIFCSSCHWRSLPLTLTFCFNRRSDCRSKWLVAVVDQANFGINFAAMSLLPNRWLLFTTSLNMFYLCNHTPKFTVLTSPLKHIKYICYTFIYI